MFAKPDVSRLSFGTSYRQFYLVDPDVPFDTASPDFWSEMASQRQLAVGPGVLGIGTASYGKIRCFFETSNTEPGMSLGPWQRVVEASIRLSTGRYRLLDCPDAIVIHEGACTPGDYRLRVHGAFLDEEVEDSAGDLYFDVYWLTLWPAGKAAVRLFKHEMRGTA